MQHHRSFAVAALVVGLGLAGYAVTQVQAVLAAAEPIIVQEVATAPVVTFSADLPQGHLITEADLVVAEFTASSVPTEAVAVVSEVVGNYLVRDVLTGEPARVPILSWEPIDAVAVPPTVIRERRAGVLVLVELP